MKMKTTSIVQKACGALVASTFALAAFDAQALVISTTGNTATSMANAVLAANSGISIVSGTASIVGTNTSSLAQYGTYSGFNLAPSSGTLPTLSMANGIVLTTGRANMPLYNSYAAYSNQTNSGGAAVLTTLANATTFDANVLKFNFTTAQDVTSVTAKFVFGSEEFPSQTVTDIFGFFVDGVNYAKFADGDLISNEKGSTNFISNEKGAYGIEYNGLTNVLSVTGLLNPNQTTHTLTIGIADTVDAAYDSGVFLNSLLANKVVATGGISKDVPEPGSLALFGAALGAAAIVRRRKSRA